MFTVVKVQKYHTNVYGAVRDSKTNGYPIFSGKGPSVWDTASHQGKIINGETGDIAADSYHKFREDIQLLKNLKVTYLEHCRVPLFQLLISIPYSIKEYSSDTVLL